jgi:hypothetical protein
MGLFCGFFVLLQSYRIIMVVFRSLPSLGILSASQDTSPFAAINAAMVETLPDHHYEFGRAKARLDRGLQLIDEDPFPYYYRDRLAKMRTAFFFWALARAISFMSLVMSLSCVTPLRLELTLSV